jgi:hypothetical protein
MSRNMSRQEWVLSTPWTSRRKRDKVPEVSARIRAHDLSDRDTLAELVHRDKARSAYARRNRS